MIAAKKSYLNAQLARIDELDQKSRARAYDLVVAYVDFLLEGKGLYLAGPLAPPSPSALTAGSFDCPSCGYRVTATYR